MDNEKKLPEQQPMFPDIRPMADDTYVPANVNVPQLERDRENLNWRDEQEEQDD